MKRTAKAWAAAIGATATAVAVAAATAQTVVADDAVDLGEYGTIAMAAATLVGTIYAVWRVPNAPDPAEDGAVDQYLRGGTPR